MDSVIEKSLTYLRTRYPIKTAFLYGSFANGMATPESDIDIIVFADIDEEFHNSEKVENYFLDAWIYPLKKAHDLAAFLHIFPFQVLVDEVGISEIMRARIKEEQARQSKTYSESERNQIESWISKMILRSAQESPEANYRYHWLVNDFSELYCRFSGQYYDGPMKTIRRMKEQNPLLYQKYASILAGEKNVRLLEEIYNDLKNWHRGSSEYRFATSD